MSAWIRRGSVILLTMLLLLTAAVAENAQIPILIDGVRVAFFDADGNLLTPKAENGLLYVPLQAFCENMGLSAEVQGQSVAVDGTRIGMFDEAGNFLTPVQMDGVDYVPLAPFCNALGIQIAEENGGFAVLQGNGFRGKMHKNLRFSPFSGSSGPHSPKFFHSADRGKTEAVLPERNKFLPHPKTGRRLFDRLPARPECGTPRRR